MSSEANPAATVDGASLWSSAQVEELTDLVAVVDSDSSLTADDLLCLWNATEHRSIVLGISGVAAIAGNVEGTSAALTLLVVDHAHRRRGIASRLLAAFEAWCREQGAEFVEAGADLGCGPWLGVPEQAVDLRAFLHVAGYEVSAETTLSCLVIPTKFRRGESSGSDAGRRVLAEPDVDSALALVDRHGGRHRELVRLAIEQGTCLAASASGEVRHRIDLLLCHSVARSAWIGPAVGTDEQPRLMAELLDVACRDLRAAGLPFAQLMPGLPLVGVDLDGLGAERGLAFGSATKALG